LIDKHSNCHGDAGVQPLMWWILENFERVRVDIKEFIGLLAARRL
jgi:hypothetical protein